MRLQLLTPVTVLTLVLFGLTPLPAQQKKEGKLPDLAIDDKMRTEVVEGALAKLNEAYVFPDVAKKMEEAVRARMANGDYDKITSGRELCDVRTAHLREVSKDKHLRMAYSVKPQPASPSKAPKDKTENLDLARKNGALNNFGFEKCERLRGNIGYLDMRGFLSPELAGDTAAAAMTFLANTDALIVDMRQNGGGQPTMVALLCSYFFDGGQMRHLNDIYTRKSDSTQQFW